MPPRNSVAQDLPLRRFTVWWPDRGQSAEDGRAVAAVDAQDAAALWADWYDYSSADYPIVGGERAEVLVLEAGHDIPLSLSVAGETTRTYRARPATADIARRAT